jgi:flagellar motility protein MotE (MotC chaperone)
MAEKRTDLVTNILAFLMLLEIALLAGWGGYAVLAGKVSKEQLRLFYKVYERQINEQVEADAESWMKHQEEQQKAKASQVSGGDAETKIAATSQEAEAARLGIEREMKDLQDREKLVQAKLEEYERARKALEETEKRIDQKLVAEKAGTGQQSFQKMLGILAAMKPQQIKEILVKMDEPMVIEVLKALEARVAAKVLAEYKTPVEIEMKKRYLDAIGEGKLLADKAAAGR